MKTKILKSVLSFVLALSLIVGSCIGASSSREYRPQCDFDEWLILQ